MHVKLYNQSAEETGTVELPDRVFGLKWNADLVHQVVTSQAANRRRGTAHAKTRGEVRGGGRKPWRQKGTGRARHGSIRSPIWIGGGVTHGPRTEKNYHRKINKKMARKALYVILSGKARDHEIVIVDDMAFPEAKTKSAHAMFGKFSQKFGKIRTRNGVLVALSKKDDAARRALRNLPYTGIEEARNLNAYGAMNYKYVMMSQNAIDALLH